MSQPPASNGLGNPSSTRAQPSKEPETAAPAQLPSKPIPTTTQLMSEPHITTTQLTSEPNFTATHEKAHNNLLAHHASISPAAEVVPVMRPPPVNTSDLELIPIDNEAMCEGIAYLMVKEWGTVWEDLVQALFEFEKSCGFLRDDGRLAVNDRPERFATWMKAHRSLNWQEPTYAVYPNEFVSWWRHLKSLTEPAEGSNANFTSLCKSGTNDVFLVVLGLVWWGDKIKEIRRWYDAVESWLAVICDVILMLVHLASMLVTSRKPVSKR
ncbi:hypothetical protein DXG01_014666 [Tephrocybe rancida]|nr:hypothetical protein DXG01_014666 [Tephrocybe rancida]